jgi:hypothetical protein
MLRFAQFRIGEPDADVAIDERVPVAIRWPRRSQEPPYYWRTGDFTESLLEIGCDSETGVLTRVTLVMARYAIEVPSPRDSDLAQFRGVPVCDLGAWRTRSASEFARKVSEDYIDERSDFLVELGARSVTLVCGQQRGNRACVSGRVHFALDHDGGLCWIRIVDIQPREREILVDSFQIMKSRALRPGG